MQCRWCGMGGDLVGCDGCISSYCEECIKSNLGKKHLDCVKKNDDWRCYSCDPSPTAELRWEAVQVTHRCFAPPAAVSPIRS